MRRASRTFFNDKSEAGAASNRVYMYTHKNFAANSFAWLNIQCSLSLSRFSPAVWLVKRKSPNCLKPGIIERKQWEREEQKVGVRMQERGETGEEWKELCCCVRGRSLLAAKHYLIVQPFCRLFVYIRSEALIALISSRARSHRIYTHETAGQLVLQDIPIYAGLRLINERLMISKILPGHDVEKHFWWFKRYIHESFPALIQ